MQPTLYTLLLNEVRLLCGAELEQASRMQDLAESAVDEEFRTFLMEHAEETLGQIQRLQQILADAGLEDQADVPGGAEGLLEDAELLVEQDWGAVGDVALAAAIRKMEYYEIASYETVIEMAEHTGLAEVAALLQETLEQERRAAIRLAELGLRLVQTQLPQEADPLA